MIDNLTKSRAAGTQMSAAAWRSEWGLMCDRAILEVDEGPDCAPVAKPEGRQQLVSSPGH